MTSVSHLADHIHRDLLDLVPDLKKSPRQKLAIMVSALIERQSCNLMELAAVLPLETDKPNSRYAWIERFLSADTVDEAMIMAALAHQIFQHLHRQNKTLIICLDQTAIGDNHAIAMVSVRVGERGLPLLWKTKPIKGNIETACYIKMLKTLADLVPQSTQVIVMADRFFNVGQIIATCKQFGWGWRLRLKQNRILTQDGGEITARERCKHHPLCPCKVMVNGEAAYVGSVHDKGHKEPWIIAMDVPPTRKRVLNYGLRWSIESMFSDAKTRGFNIEDTHILRSDRLSKLILVIATAMYWCVITGMERQKNTFQKAA